MNNSMLRITGIVSVIALCLGAQAAMAQKSGGILKVYHRDTPPSGSIHEEATTSTTSPYMGVYNNLVMYDQAIAKESMDTIVPDLASEWSWNDDKTSLTFKLREGVKWHDGKPFTANDVKCTWDLLQDKGQAKLRKNPRKAWYTNLKEVTVDNDFQATFHLDRPQPAFIALLASGYSPVYPCHVPPKTMRTAPVGTGPFKFVELKQNERIVFTKNQDYWKPGKPYLDGITWTIIKSRATRMLAFTAGEFDMTMTHGLPTPSLRELARENPKAHCDLTTTGGTANLIVNREKPPFDNPDIRTAMALTIDRDAFNKILGEGTHKDGGALLPPPEGNWGLPKEILDTLPGYGPNVEENREKARKLMEKYGYGPDNHLKIKVSTRNNATYRDPAVILIDHLKQIYIDGTLDVIETSNWFSTVARKDYQVGLNLTANGVDDPDSMFFENFSCGSQRNYTGYCNPELEKLFVKQSMMADQEERKKLVWEIDKQLQLDGARPIIFHFQWGNCWHPYVKGLTTHVNSMYNGWRMEDAWLDK